MREGIATVVGRQTDMVVDEADNGAKGLDLFRLLQPDVTLMDLQMPGLDGLGAIQQIREEAPQARILVLTTYQADARAWQALKAGAAGYPPAQARPAHLPDQRDPRRPWWRPLDPQ